MQIKQVLQDKSNELFRRKEIKIVVESDSSPSYSETKKILSEKFSKPEENIVISGVRGKFGRRTFLVTANVYDSLEDKEKTETIKEKKEK